MDVLVIGSANADLVVGVEQRPSAGETVLGGDLAVRPGGKGANQAVAAGRLGARVAFSGCLGADAYGDLVLASLVTAGVDVTQTCRLDGVPTGVALISVTPDGENAIIVSPGANGHVTKGDVERAVRWGGQGGPAVVVLQLELPQDVVEHAARLADRAGARVVLNLAPPARLTGEVLALCDPLVLNEHEAAVLLARMPSLSTGDTPDTPGLADAAGLADTPDAPGLADTPDLADTPGLDIVPRLLALGPRSVVLTLGAAGAVAARPGESVHVPAPAVAPVDTTGAGDALTGALAWRLAEGDDLADAVRFAVRVATTATLRPGAQPSFPRPGEVLAPAAR